MPVVTHITCDVTVPAEPHAIREFLLERGGGLQYPGGTLYEHVRRVAELLAEWGASEEAQAAGLCHACYGTHGYAPALLGLAQRAVLRDLIGARAESLGYPAGMPAIEAGQA
jgi:hypothetical protein